MAWNVLVIRVVGKVSRMHIPILLSATFSPPPPPPPLLPHIHCRFALFEVLRE